MSESAWIALLAVMGSGITGVGTGLAWLARWITAEMKECATDRLQLKGDIGELKGMIRECAEDRVELRSELTALHKKVSEVDKHIENTDSIVIETVKKIEGQG